MKVSELTGSELNYWVARAEGLKKGQSNWVAYSTVWAAGGPIIERERICVRGPGPMGGPNPEYYWTAYIDTGSYAGGGHNGNGTTPLIAAMRCFVASKFGEEVDDSQAHNVQGS